MWKKGAMWADVDGNKERFQHYSWNRKHESFSS